MSTFADSAFDADNYSVSEISEAEAKADVLAQLDKILLDAADCGCEDCTEIIFVAAASYKLGNEDGLAEVDAQTSEAVKSTLDTVNLAPSFAPDYDFAPAITDEDVPPVNWDYEDDTCGDPDCLWCYGGAYDCSVPDEPVSNEVTDEEADELLKALDAIFGGESGGEYEEPCDCDECKQDEKPLTLDFVYERLLSLGDAVEADLTSLADAAASVNEELYRQVAEVVQAIGGHIADLKADVQKLSEKQDADALYLDNIGERLLAVEQFVADEKADKLASFGIDF